MTKHIFPDENYQNFFFDIIGTRESARRKTTILFKPLNEIDFKKLNCERNGSYTKLPDSMPIMQAPPNKLNPLADTMFNKQWVSVPHGSEVNFVVNSKNSYEEALFKCEDERYEFDISIYSFQMAVKWLNELENIQDEQRITNLVQRIIRLKVLQKIYSNNHEILGIFQTKPLSIAKTLIERVNSKLAEMRDAKFD